MVISPITSVGESVNASLRTFPSSAARAVVLSADTSSTHSSMEMILLPVRFIALLLSRHRLVFSKIV